MNMADNSPILILFLYTEKSVEEDNANFKNILSKLRNDTKYKLSECKTLNEATEILAPKTDEGDRFHVVIVHFHSSESSLWKDVFHKTRAHNKYSEMIVTVVEPNEKTKTE